MIGLVLAGLALILAAGPAALFFKNLTRYVTPPLPAGERRPAVSVLIPARNEEAGIAAAVEAALASERVDLELLVLDDHSTDGTASIVSAIAARDRRLRLLHGPELPAGWCGKQHACQVLADAARHSLLVFVDADVRLQPEGLARLIAFQASSNADLVSGIPRQETATLLEKLVIPLIHFILLGFLPIDRMRGSRSPAYAAGCGQLFLARKSAYKQAGGHAAIRTSLHDGILLPRAFRKAGFATDLCDATELATCRMYRSASELWRGLAKNATEGLAHPRTILPATIILFGGQVLPMFLLFLSSWLTWPALLLACLATAILFSPRLAGMSRFRQSALGAALHPLGVVVLLAIQWYGLLSRWLGKPAAWKGRNYPAS